MADNECAMKPSFVKRTAYVLLFVSFHLEIEPPKKLYHLENFAYRIFSKMIYYYLFFKKWKLYYQFVTGKDL